jgi:hypothetical protein
MCKMRRCLWLCVAVCLAASVARAQVGDTPRIRYKQVSKILPNGDAAPRAAQNLQQFVQAMLGRWQQSIPSWRTLGQEAVSVNGKQAYRIRASGTPNNQPTYAEYVFVLSGPNQFLLGIQCPQQAAQQYQGIFQQVLAGWHVQ